MASSGCCRAWDWPRSSLYARRKDADAQSADQFREPLPRGPQPRLSNDKLWALSEQESERSFFTGEGHRPVWRRLRRKGSMVSKQRVLRLTRRHNYLVPSRVRQEKVSAHTGSIATPRPNEQWGADGIMFYTQAEGKHRAFFCVDHFNSECLGWHAVKMVTVSPRLNPIRQGLVKEFGAVGEQVARGLALRMNHGTQYASEHYQGEKYFGVTPSFAYVPNRKPITLSSALVNPKKTSAARRAVPEPRRSADGDTCVHQVLQLALVAGKKRALRFPGTS